MKKALLPILLIGIAITVSNCSKEGPVGPAGPTGAQGEPGPRGATGATGATGTANVIYSAWTGLQTAVRDTTVDGTKLKVTHIAAPGLTQTIIDQGTILVYMRFGTTALALPYTGYAGALVSTVSFIPRPQRLFLTRFTHNNSASLGFGVVSFRYILIPGGVLAGRTAGSTEKTVTINDREYTESELKAMPYEEVTALLGIPNE